MILDTLGDADMTTDDIIDNTRFYAEELEKRFPVRDPMIETLLAALEKSWDSAGRAFCVNAQRFFRSRFPFLTLRERRESCDTQARRPVLSIPMLRTTRTKEN